MTRRVQPLLGHLTARSRGVLMIVSGTAVGQIAALLAAPALTRLYSPSSFGIFTVVSSLIMTIGTVAALRFELAIPIPEREDRAQSLAALGFISCLATAVAGSFVVLVWGLDMANLFGEPDLMPWLWLVPAIAALVGCFTVLNQLAIRHRRYGAIARRNVTQSVGMVLVQIGAGLASFRSGGLIVGLGFGQVVGTVGMMPSSGLLSPDARRGRTPGELRAALVRFRRFPLMLAPAGLINALGLQLPVLFIAYYFGSQVAGWLGLTQRVLGLPVTLLGLAVAQVYLGELSRAVRGESVHTRELFAVASRRLAVAALGCLAVLLMAGPWLFSTVFGSEWLPSGQYAQALAVSLALQLVAVPLSQTLIVFERQTLQLLWDVGRLAAVMVAVVVVATGGGSALVTIWALAAASGLSYGLSWILSMATIYRHCSTAESQRESDY